MRLSSSPNSKRLVSELSDDINDKLIKWRRVFFNKIEIGNLQEHQELEAIFFEYLVRITMKHM